MKTLHICSYYISSGLYQKLFNSLNKIVQVLDVYVYVHKNYNIKGELPSNVILSNCYNKLDRLIFYLKHKKALNDIKVKFNVINNYDIIHAHSLFSNGYIAYRLNQEYNVPYIVAVRNTDVNLFFKKMIHLRGLGIKILKNAKMIIFISKPYKEHTINKFIPEKYKKEIEKKSIIIPNGIDEFWLKNKFKERTIPKNKIKLIYAGKVDTNKNIETTITACKLLIDEGYKISFKVVGKILERKYSALLNKYPFVEYIPYCQKEELINHYRASDIFVMPSKNETFGLVYAEAMSQGLPIIYTRGQGFDGQFDEGEVGYSVEYNSSDEIVKRIKDILGNYNVISNSSLTKVDRFDWSRIAKIYYCIYKDVL